MKPTGLARSLFVVFGIAITNLVIAAVPADVKLPDGIEVRPDGASGHNQVRLRIGAGLMLVANCLPMTPQTEDLFDAEFFEAMNPSAFFINVGRGGTVDTEALIVALETGQIAAAGLDVTDPEPLPEGHPLWKAPNLIITPHYAAWSDVGRERRWLLYRENLRRFVAGEPLLSVVDPARGY